ncbi:hypothetical protein LP420_15650 [Massilia sp. B-10]|nr:hypothetical protein LP420_15650 [Massilia sp. B-10]
MIADLRFDLSGGQHKWALRGASAVTPWGYARADGSIAANQPFKLDATASLTQLVVPKGQQPKPSSGCAPAATCKPPRSPPTASPARRWATRCSRSRRSTPCRCADGDQRQASGPRLPQSVPAQG